MWHNNLLPIFVSWVHVLENFKLVQNEVLSACLLLGIPWQLYTAATEGKRRYSYEKELVSFDKQFMSQLLLSTYNV